MDLLAALELRGPSTTSELACFVIEKQHSKGKIKEMGKSFVKLRTHYYWDHLHGNAKKKSGKKIVGTYESLLEKNYVKIIKMKKSNVGIYFPTLSGHLVSLGYEYSDKEIQEFIKNASTNSLYFAFLYDIINKISLDFVKEIFLEPIKKMIKQKRIQFDDDYRLNFDIIVNATALKIHQIIDDYEQKNVSYDLKTNNFLVKADPNLVKQLDVLIKNTWFDLQANSKWISQLIELYYPTEEQQKFYQDHRDYSDIHLIYKVMREIHTNYYGSYRVKVPAKYYQKFPIPIRRNREKKRERIKFPDKSIMTSKELYDFQKSQSK